MISKALMIGQLTLCLGLQSQAPLQVQVVQPMSFGNLVASSFGGSVRLTEEGVLNPVSGAIWQGTRSFPTRGVVKVYGPPRARFQVRFDAWHPVLPGRSGALVIEELTSTLPNWMGTIGEDGSAEFHVGALLSVPSGALPDTYLHQGVFFQVDLLGVPGLSGTLEGVARRSIKIQGCLLPSIRLERIRDLDFGGLVPGAVDGPFLVLPGGGCQSPSPSGPTLFRGQPSPALFSLSGAPGACYSIDLPTSCSMEGPGGARISVREFTIDQPREGLVPATGQLTFGAGATLLVGRSQAPGTYVGHFIITVSYQ